MAAQSTAVAIARAFTEAWTSQDMATAGSYVDENVVFDGPLGHADGKAQYLEGLNGLIHALGVTGVRILAAFGDETQALLMYDLVTDQFGPLTCTKLLTIRDGKIQTDRLTFDSYVVRKS
ncbi:MAG TPA: nuclear transport factor 2 family protein [Ktedonobacterales bacterium]|nr:nuclear transport factor 2 family protein [Ktedonobacterales bacterium]